jgi:hypothetical protein
MEQPSNTNTTNGTALELPEYGPAMLALPNDKQRAFVAALFNEDAPRKGDGLLIYAAREAQYGTATSSTKSLSVIANRIVHNERTQKAINEYAITAVRTGLAPEVVRSIKNVVRDPGHRDHARILALVYDRLDPLQTLHTVKVEDNRPPTVEATQKVLDRIEQLMQRVGLAPPKVIEGDFQVVEKGAPA